MKKNPGWLGYIRDEILPSYIGIIINQYKDPYLLTSIMASRKVFFVAHLLPHSLDEVRENMWSSKVWTSAGFMFHELGEGTSSWDEPW